MLLLIVATNIDGNVAYAANFKKIDEPKSLDGTVAVTRPTTWLFEDNAAEWANINGLFYINNYRYFVNSPKIAINDGSDNENGTCTTVAMQLILGYHNYYTDRRLIPNVADDGTVFLGENYGQLDYHPNVWRGVDWDYGWNNNGEIVLDPDIGAIGTQDAVYRKIIETNEIAGDMYLGQMFPIVNLATQEFLNEYSDIADDVDIDFSITYDRETVVSEINANRPVILGTYTQDVTNDGSISDNFHVVVAYGYAYYNGEFGYICHKGYGKESSRTWLPEEYFHFYNTVRISHEHTLVEQPGVVNNTCKHFKCSVCGCDILDDLYVLNDAEDTIVALKYAPQSDVVIPNQIRGKFITGIASEVFKGTNIVSVDLGCCYNLGDGVFENCSQLNEITFPDSTDFEAINNIEDDTGIELNASFTSIPERMFKGCSSLSTITLPETTHHVWTSAFEDCTSLVSVFGVNNIQYFGSYAFRNCNALYSFYLGTEVETISYGAFAGCNNCVFSDANLNDVYVSDNIVYFRETYNRKIVVASGKTGPVLDLKEYQGIQASAFENNTNVTTIYFNEINLGNKAFYGCTNLTDVYFDAFMVPNFGLDCFNNESSTNENFTTYVPYYLQDDFRDVIGGYETTITSRPINVSYYSDGIKVAEQTKYYGAVISDLYEILKEGYTFNGWYKDSDCTTDKIESDGVAVWTDIEDINLYAKWNANEYTISFDGDGCQGIQDKTVVHGMPIGELPEPSREGYTFSGWIDQEGNIAAETDIYLLAGDMLLTALWQANTYNIFFYSQGALLQDITLTCEYDSLVEALPTITKTGYELIGWNYNEDGSGTYCEAPFVYSNDDNMNLYAQWDPIIYSISYVLNGGVNNENNPTMYTIESSDIELLLPSKVGHTFLGWTFNDSVVETIEQGTTGDFILEAQWQVNEYQVTLDANGGILNGETQLTVTYGELFAIEAVATKTGHIFEGWYDNDGVKYATDNGECVKTWDKAENSTLYANWTIESYEIQINNNGSITWLGANGLQNEQCTIQYGTILNAINLIAEFKQSTEGFREGHIFDHFEFEEEMFEYDSVPDFGEDGEIITILPVWVKEVHTIYFNTLTTQTFNEIVEEYDADIDLPDQQDVVRTGYEFIGWSQSTNGSLVNWVKMPDLTLNTQNNGSVQLYAQYSPIEYTITYVLDGGSNHLANSNTYTIEQAVTLEDAFKLNYIFGGWYLDESYNTKMTQIVGMTGDITLYAKFSPMEYTIYFHSNNDMDEVVSVNYLYDTPSNLKENTFVWTGRHFIGWALASDGNVQYVDSEEIVNLAIGGGSLNLYAKWETNTYTIQFNANGGTGTMLPIVVTYDKYSALPECGFTRSGYLFDGWSTTPNGEKKYGILQIVKNLTDVNEGVVNLYAVWIPQYTITFDKNGGSGGTSSIVVTYGLSLPDITPPTRTGYTFLGYYDDPEDGYQYYNANNPSMGVRNYNINANTTLYAHWEAKQYTITAYDENGTYYIATATATYGEALPRISTFAPSKVGYAFAGFFTKKNGQGTKYYKMVVKNDAQGADMYGYNYYYREMVEPAMNQYTYDGNISLYAHFTALTLSYTYQLYDENYTSIGSRTITINGANSTTTVTAPTIDGYTFSHFICGTEKYTNATSAMPTILKRATSNGSVYLESVIAAYYVKDACVSAGTLITLANGTQVPVELLTGSEDLLVWNMLIGRFDSANIVFIDSEPMGMREIINLTFSDGTSVKVISEHAFWDIDLNQYVYLDANAAQYIGHSFNKQVYDENGNMCWIGVQLVDVTITREETTAWSPVTYNHLCYYVNGMLSIPGGITGLFNYLEIDSETMTVNQEALQRDIEQYGLFTYEELATLVTITPEVFEAFNGQYLKIAIGKGMLTIDDIQTMLNTYSSFFV